MNSNDNNNNNNSNNNKLLAWVDIAEIVGRRLLSSSSDAAEVDDFIGNDNGQSLAAAIAKKKNNQISLDYGLMNDNRLILYSRMQLGLFLTGLFVCTCYLYSEFLHYARSMKRANANGICFVGSKECEIELRMSAAEKKFDVLLETSSMNNNNEMIDNSAPGGSSSSSSIENSTAQQQQQQQQQQQGQFQSINNMNNNNAKFTQIGAMRILQGDSDSIERQRLVLRSWSELFIILFVFYICDRTNAFPERTKSYSRDFFIAIFVTLASYGCYQTLHKSKTSAPLNREQTEEWKGWMQVLFLLYHYFKASEIYNAIRIFIAAYVWMTGFGNFSYYHVRKDFSVGRFSQMMWRLNFFVLFVCIALRNDYVLYYICPMHTLFTLFVYFSLLVFKEHNTSTNMIMAKMVGLTAMVYIIWEVPGVFTVLFKPFEWLLSYTDPTKPDVNPMHEWFFRSGLDRYIWIYGMICAFLHPKYEAFVRWVDEKPVKERMVIQACILSLSSLVGYWWYTTYYVLPKLEYNVVHPYTSWIPITLFIIFRNFSFTLRSYYIQIFCECGKITLETYISQFHIWLSTSVPNGQPGLLLGLLPEDYPVLNFMLCTAIYVGISQRIFTLTNDLKIACVPNANNRLLTLHAYFALAWFVCMGIFGSLLLLAV